MNRYICTITKQSLFIPHEEILYFNVLLFSFSNANGSKRYN
jgi:hypothetical protein